jgi:hypothetical protein
MRTLAPATAEAVLTDAEMELCLRHYTHNKPAQAWISDGDAAPDLVWDDRHKMKRLSGQLADTHAEAAPVPLPACNTRFRDQYLQLHYPKKALQPSTPAKEYVLISEDDDGDEEGKLSASSSQPSTETVAGRGQSSTGARRSRKAVKASSTSPSPRCGGTGDGGSSNNASQGSRGSPRPSTGSSVVIMSQPTMKLVDTGVGRGQRSRSPTKSKSTSHSREHEAGDEVGKKRQRSMEEFMYRGA